MECSLDKQNDILLCENLLRNFNTYYPSVFPHTESIPYRAAKMHPRIFFCYNPLEKKIGFITLCAKLQPKNKVGRSFRNEV